MRSIYMTIVAATLVFGFLMPQTGPRRKNYILLMTAIHIFISGFRYQFLTGDLMKYHTSFQYFAGENWYSEAVWNGGKNFGFFLYMKLIHFLTGGNYQTVLFVVAVVIHAVLALMVYRYSPAPWMSYLLWNCMAFYIFGFSAMKQSLAMAFTMLSFVGIANRNLKYYLVCMAIAGAIHMPSLVFLPAYWFCRLKIKPWTLVIYVMMGFALFTFKNQFIQFISSFYYEDDEIFVYSGHIGNRFIMILGFTLFSLVFSGFENPNLEKLFSIMAISTMLQMFSSFDNIFTRMTDYYFQLSVLYLPMVFYSSNQPMQRHAMQPMLRFNARSKHLLAILVVIFAIWFYYTCNINVNISYSVDDYLNYRFLWDVK